MNSPWGREQWLRHDPEECRPFPGGHAMAGDDKSRTGRTAAGRAEAVRPRAKAPSERPFDMWLQKQLHAMYDEIASEPLPNDLLGLIDSDADEAGRGHKGEPGKNGPDDNTK